MLACLLLGYPSVFYLTAYTRRGSDCLNSIQTFKVNLASKANTISTAESLDGEASMVDTPNNGDDIGNEHVSQTANSH